MVVYSGRVDFDHGGCAIDSEEKRLDQLIAEHGAATLSVVWWRNIDPEGDLRKIEVIMAYENQLGLDTDDAFYEATEYIVHVAARKLGPGS